MRPSTEKTDAVRGRSGRCPRDSKCINVRAVVYACGGCVITAQVAADLSFQIGSPKRALADSSLAAGIQDASSVAGGN
jgi:uncharacterized metal-binding protein